MYGFGVDFGRDQKIENPLFDQPTGFPLPGPWFYILPKTYYYFNDPFLSHHDRPQQYLLIHQNSKAATSFGGKAY